MARAEDLVQQAIVEGINTFCPDCYAFAVPNAARRTAGGRAGNAVPGLRRGVFDLCIHGPWQRVFYMEVKKDDRETLSK